MKNINGAVNSPESILVSELVNEFSDLEDIIGREAHVRLCNSVVYALSKTKASFDFVKDCARDTMESFEESLYLLHSRLGDKS